MLAEQNMMASTADYGLEKAIEIDFDALLAADETSPMIDSMQKMSRDEIEAIRMAASPAPKPGVKYVTKMVERTVDDNPRFQLFLPNGNSSTGRSLPEAFRTARASRSW